VQRPTAVPTATKPRPLAPPKPSPPPPPIKIRSPREAEFFCAEWLQAAGFTDAAATRATGDGGIDVSADGAVAQVKRQVSKVGRPDLNRFVGATVHLDGGVARFFFSSGGYTPDALKYASGMASVYLFTFDDTGLVVPANTTAEAFATEAGVLDERARQEMIRRAELAARGTTKTRSTYRRRYRSGYRSRYRYR
jgi:hypothetical protein